MSLTMKSRPPMIWIGLVHVIAAPDSDVLDGAAGAFAMAAAPADDAADFASRVAGDALQLGLEVTSVEEVRRALWRGQDWPRRRSHRGVAQAARESGRVAWDTFRSYDE
jgi:hypothetical protein